MAHAQFALRPRRSTRSILIVTAVLTMVMGVLAGQAPPAYAATADKIAPAASPVGFGITIAGTALDQTTGVTFLGAAGPEDDVAAGYFIALEPKKLVVQVPAGAKSGPIAVTTPEGTASTPVAFTVFEAPEITAVSSTWGKPDDVLTITGQNLMGAKKAVVAIGSKKATPFTTSTQTEVQVKVPSGLPGGTVPLTVTTTGGVARSEFTIGPSVKGIAPKVGTTAGGTVATITGAGFTGVDNFTDDPATAGVNESFDGVKIGGTRVTDLIVVSDKELVVEVPPGTDPAAAVVVSTKSGNTIAESGDLTKFMYQPIPVIQSLSKNWNAVGTASDVVLTGINLTETSAVTVGGIAPTAVVADTGAGTLTITPPVGAKAAVSSIQVVNTMPSGVAFKAAVPFGYIAEPVVTKLSAMSAAAGATVTVTGTGFDQGSTVKFGANDATCKVVSFLALSCTVPAGSGVVDVVVTNGIGASATGTASQFTYLAGTVTPPTPVGLPVVAGLLPAYGATGSTIALKGANFGTVSKVEFSGDDETWVDAPGFLVVAPGRVVVRVPAAARRGEIRVTNAVGRIETVGRVFTKTVVPTISSIDVVGDTNLGATPGDLLKIQGDGLMIKGAKTIVTIGGKVAAVQSRPTPTATTIVVKVPPSIGGQESVVVSTPLGSATAGKQLYYLPEVKAVKPVTYSRLGGTVATITGSGFTGVDNVTVLEGRPSAVTFRGVKSAKLVYMSDKMLVAVTSPGSATADDLVVTTQYGNRFGNSAGQTRPVDSPLARIDSVTPSIGRADTTNPDVTLTGAHLYQYSEVKFGSVLATVKSAAVDGSSMVVSPPNRPTTGTVGITVTNYDEGESYATTTPGLYTYEIPAGSITGTSVSTGLPGSTVTIIGTHFTGVTNVRFDTVEATFTVGNANTIYAVVPVTPSTLQGTTTNITVVNGSGQPTTADPATADDWTWSSSPIVTGMTPLTGQQGSTLTISGTGFTGATAVAFGDYNATSFTVVDDRTITAVVPVSPAAGAKADVTVTANGLTSPEPLDRTANDWTWHAVSVVTSMTPNPGSAWQTITVYGRNFTNVRSVTINGISVTPTVVNSTTLRFTAPSRPAQSERYDRPVIITNGSGVPGTAEVDPATGKAANLFTWS